MQALSLIAMILIIVAFVLMDILAALRVHKYRFETFDGQHNRSDFNILVPIYGKASYLENIEYLSAYGDRVILCTTHGESSEFYDALDELSMKYGFHVFRSAYVPSLSKKRRTGGTIRDRVIRDALMDVVEQPYVVCIDADTTTSRPLEELVGELAYRQADAASIRLVPQSDGPLLVKLQQFEYRLAMRLRFLMPWLISGACHVARTDVWRDVMSRHSLFFQGNDVEAGLLAEQLGYTVTHIPFEVLTEVPDKFQPWWRQRLAWAGGEVRLFIANFRYIVHHPFFWFYGAIIVIALFIGRWYALAHPCLGLAIALVLYYVAVCWVHWAHRSWWLLLMPLYSLLYSVVIVPLGIITYLTMSIPERNFGIIRPNHVQQRA